MIIINCLFGTLKKSFESCSVQSGETGGVSFWNVRETGGQESHFGACICPTPALVKVFLVDTIIELLLERSGDIIKFVAGPLPDVYLKALLFF